ncbi:MAG: PIN domain-containing protein [Acidobacteria bacterium]|nr:PIN domain-containing protein [Acidobacteriota bacterium]
MSDRVFVDTNIFVYADDRSARTKRVRARTVLSELIRAKRVVVSTQVMQEYFAAAIKKLGLSPERARIRVERLNRLDVVLIRPELILGAIDLCRLHALSFWDALAVRSASAAGCGRLLSEDLQDGQTIDGVRIENPFG